MILLWTQTFTFHIPSLLIVLIRFTSPSLASCVSCLSVVSSSVLAECFVAFMSPPPFIGFVLFVWYRFVLYFHGTCHFVIFMLYTLLRSARQPPAVNKSEYKNLAADWSCYIKWRKNMNRKNPALMLLWRNILMHSGACALSSWKLDRISV